MPTSAPRARARSSFSSLEEVTMTEAPSAFPIWMTKTETPPVPRVSTHSPGAILPSVTSAFQAVRAAMGRVEAEAASSRSGRLQDRALREEDALRRDPRSGDSESRSDVTLLERPVDPVGDEVSHHSISGANPGHAFAHRGDRYRRRRSRESREARCSGCRSP